MKILVFFIDMLRPDRLNIWNNMMPETPLDKWIKRCGGTIYKRAYTPGPDTPRSQAATWSSRYPKFNGCDVRIKYPLYNLKNPQNNFFRVFKNAGYDLNFFLTEGDRLLGELPEDFTDDCNYSREKLLSEYLDDLEISDDSLTYVVFDDFHNAVSDYYASEKAVKFGIYQIRRCIELIEKKIGWDSFDFVLIYSDHGFRMYKEPMNNSFEQLGEGRSNVFLMTRKKGEKRLRVDCQIRSVMDIGPTLCEVAGLVIPYKVDGISLFDEKGSEYIVVNDHKTFSVDLGQAIEYWGVYTSKGFAATDCYLRWESNYELKEEEKACLIQVLKERGDQFEENTKATMVKIKYQNYITTDTCYFDGSHRKKHPNIKQRIVEVMRWVCTPLKRIIGA